MNDDTLTTEKILVESVLADLTTAIANLERARDDLESLLGGSSLLSRVKRALPADLLPKLHIGEGYEGEINIMADWLGRENWRRVNDVVKRFGGQWISMGDASHWRIPGDQEASG